MRIERVKGQKGKAEHALQYGKWQELLTAIKCRLQDFRVLISRPFTKSS